MTPDSLTTCQRCGAEVVLAMAQMARSGHYVLASDPQRFEWRCMTTPAKPVQSHEPARYANGVQAPPLAEPDRRDPETAAEREAFLRTARPTGHGRSGD